MRVLKIELAIHQKDRDDYRQRRQETRRKDEEEPILCAGDFETTESICGCRAQGNRCDRRADADENAVQKIMEESIGELMIRLSGHGEDGARSVLRLVRCGNEFRHDADGVIARLD